MEEKQVAKRSNVNSYERQAMKQFIKKDHSIIKLA